MKSLKVFLCLMAACAIASAKPKLQISAGADSVEISNYSHEVKEDGVNFTFPTAEGEKLVAFSKRHVGEKLELKIGNQTIVTPRVSQPLKANALWLTVESKTALDTLATVLH